MPRSLNDALSSTNDFEIYYCLGKSQIVNFVIKKRTLFLEFANI